MPDPHIAGARRADKDLALEIIVTSLDDAQAAAGGGADRFELCSALALGGLTASCGLLELVKRQMPSVPAMFMLRPREAGMAYTPGELDVMQRDAELALEHQADGLVFGMLTEAGEIDLAACRRILRMAQQRAGAAVQTVFHRAFDVVRDPARALEQLIDLGFTRVLTSGRAPRAVEGLSEIHRTVEQAAGRIEVLAGGGINAETVARVVRESGVEQVHLSGTKSVSDHSTAANPSISFGAFAAPGPQYRVTDQAAVRAVRRELDRL